MYQEDANDLPAVVVVYRQSEARSGFTLQAAVKAASKRMSAVGWEFAFAG